MLAARKKKGTRASKQHFLSGDKVNPFSDPLWPSCRLLSSPTHAPSSILDMKSTLYRCGSYNQDVERSHCRQPCRQRCRQLFCSAGSSAANLLSLHPKKGSFTLRTTLALTASLPLTPVRPPALWFDNHWLCFASLWTTSHASFSAAQRRVR
jgi:hypothetical protein